MQRGSGVVLIGLFLLALTGVACTGCKKQEAEEKVEITLMHGWGGTLKTHNTMQEIYAEFSRENPDIVLKCVPYSDSTIAVEKANDMLAVGKMPDIISTNGLTYYVNNAVKRNMALNLMPYIEKDRTFASEIHPAVFETWETEKHALYTIPDAMEVAGYWYNKRILKEAGITDSSGDVQIPATWEKFWEMIETLDAWKQTAGYDGAVCSMDPVQTVEGLFLARLAGEGSAGLAAAEDEKAVIGLDELTRTVGDICKLRQYSADVDNIENARQNFYDGKSILYFNGVWESDALRGSGEEKDFACADYPSVSGQSLAYVSASSGYVLARQEDQNKEEAGVRFLKYMLSDQVQMKIAVRTGQAPSNPDIEQEEVIGQYPLFGMALNVAYDADIQIKTIRSVWPEPKVDIVEEYLKNGTLTQEEIHTMCERLNEAE